MSPSAPTQKFVVLHHLGSPEGDHFDLLVERDPTSDLETWRLPTWPIFAPTEIKKLRDHRRAYLTFQGQISHDRGHVVRIAEGTAEVERTHPSVTIDFPSLGLTLDLQQVSDDEWIARPFN